MASNAGRRPHSSWKQRLGALANIRRFLLLIWEASPWLVFLSLVCRALRACSPVALFYIGKLIIDAVVPQLRDGHSETHKLLGLLLLELTVALVTDMLGRAIALTQSLLADRFTNNLNLRIVEHASNLDLAAFENSAFHDKLQRAQQNAQGRLQILEEIAGVVEHLCSLLALTSTLLVFSPWLLAMLVVAVLPIFFGETELAAHAYSLFYRWTPKLRELDYFRSLGTMIETAAEVKAFALTNYLVGRYRYLADLFYSENRTIIIRRAAVGSALSSLGTLGYYAAYAVIIFRTATGTLTVGDLAFLGGSFRESRHLIEDLMLDLSSLSQATAYLNDLFEFFQMKSQVCSKPAALDTPRPIRRGLEFHNVTFRYPGAERPILNDISFEIRPGEKVALVGENGSGKTTITKLIPRLYDPSAGEILLDGIDLREYQLEAWRQEIGVIFQNYVRYNMSISENIGLGRVDLIHDRV